jgi:hypothetical protein
VSESSITVYRALAAGVEIVHALAMIAWGLGLPLLVWHRYERLVRAYMWFALGFVTTSIASNLVFGECFLTTLARHLWTAAGGFREQVPFIVLFTNAVAGIRPSTREAVLAWEVAIVATSIGTLWCWRKTRRGRFDNLDDGKNDSENALGGSGSRRAHGMLS